MSNTKIPSPARSYGGTTPRKHLSRPRRSQSVASPARSTRLTDLIKDAFQVSPISQRRSVLNNETEIQEPLRKSWWKNLDDQSRDMMDLFKNIDAAGTDNVLDDDEAQGQEKNSFSVNIPDTSDDESITSVIVTQRRLFSGKENNKKYVVNYATRSSPESDNNSSLAPRNLFNQRQNKSKPIFPATLLSKICAKTANDTSVESPVKTKKSHCLFGHKPGTKRKNIIDFVASDNEDEANEIVSRKVFNFPRQSIPVPGGSSKMISPTSSALDIEDWELLPSSTMIGQQSDVEVTPKRRKQSTNFDNSKSQKGLQQKQKNLTHDNTLVPNNSFKDMIEMENDEENNTISNISLSKSNKESDKKDNSSFNVSQNNKTLTQNNNDANSIVIENNNHPKESSMNCDRTKTGLENPNVINENVEVADIIDKSITKIKDAQSNHTNSSEDQNIQLYLEDDIEMVEHQDKKQQEDDINVQESNNLSKEIIISRDVKNAKVNNMSGFTERQENINNVINDDDPMHKEIEKQADTNSKMELQNKVIHSFEKSAMKSIQDKSNEFVIEAVLESDNESFNQIEEDSGGLSQKESENIEHEYDVQLEENSEINHDEHDVEQSKQNRTQEGNIQTNEVCNTREHCKSLSKSLNESKINDPLKLPESALNCNSSRVPTAESSFDIIPTERRRTSLRKTKSVILNHEPLRHSTRLSDGTRDSSANNSGWDSHRTTRKTLRQTFGNDFTPRKSLRTLVMEKSARLKSRHTVNNIAMLDNKSRDAIETRETSKDNEDLEQTEFLDNVIEHSNKNNEAITHQMPFKNNNGSYEEIIHSNNDEAVITSNNSDYKETVEASNEEETANEPVEEMINHSEIDDEINKSDANDEMVETDKDDEDPNKTNSNDCDEMVDNIDGDEEVNQSDGPDEIIETDKDDEDINNSNTNDLEEMVDSNNVDNVEIYQSDNCDQEEMETSNNGDSDVEETVNTNNDDANYTDENEEVVATNNSNDQVSHSDDSDPEIFDTNNSDDEETEPNFLHDNEEISKMPQANSTEYNMFDSVAEPFAVGKNIMESRKRKQAMSEILEQIKADQIERQRKIKSDVDNWLKTRTKPSQNTNFFKVPQNPAIRRSTKPLNKPKPKTTNSLPFTLPEDFLEDLKYKPPKRYQPKNATWATKRLYAFLETKLEAKYDYKARVRAEKLVDTIFNFTRAIRRLEVAPSEAVAELKHEMARLNVVTTHFDFYEFFKTFMPRDVRLKVVPSITNKIAQPKPSVFADILQ